MKLLGYTNGTKVVASMGRHDYVAIDDIMADGGNPGTNMYGGYNRWRGMSLWFEVPQNFAELYNDYNRGNPRKYGIWNLADVKILSPEEVPDFESFEYKAENTIWGTNGINGDKPTTYVLLKDCEKDHLENILALLKTRFGTEEMQKFVQYWIDKKTLED